MHFHTNNRDLFKEENSDILPNAIEHHHHTGPNTNF